MREACTPHASRLTPNMLGDVVISVPTARRQAKEAGRSLDEELACCWSMAFCISAATIMSEVRKKRAGCIVVNG